MATNTNNASTFKIVAGLTALSLVVAAALVYLQASSSGNSSASELGHCHRRFRPRRHVRLTVKRVRSTSSMRAFKESHHFVAALRWVVLPTGSNLSPRHRPFSRDAQRSKPFTRRPGR